MNPDGIEQDNILEYEAYFVGYGTVRWTGELPEYIETLEGQVHKDILKLLAGTRVWERTNTGWVLSDKHA